MIARTLALVLSLPLAASFVPGFVRWAEPQDGKLSGLIADEVGAASKKDVPALWKRAVELRSTAKLGEAGELDRVLDEWLAKRKELAPEATLLLAAKRTAELYPLCHPLALEHLEIEIEPQGKDALEVRCRARCEGKTGVEMEALTGAAIAALAIYDMTKALDKAIRIEFLELLEKTGGKSGPWRQRASS